MEAGEKLDLAKAPVGWDLRYGELVIRDSGGGVIAKYSTVMHPTLVAAHSPPGSGEAGVVPAGIENIGKAAGKALLVTGHLYLAYRKALEEGVEVILWFSRSRYSSAVPYAGLFLTPEETGGKGIPVFTLPYRVASTIMEKISSGTEVRVEYSADTVYTSSTLPVLEACIGEGEHVVGGIAHICHPSPGAHDNASGSAVLAGAATALAKIYRKLGLDTRICMYWVPEYTGTIGLFTRDILREEKVVGVLNIDMIASKQSITGSTLHSIRSMLIHAGALTPIAKLSLDAVYRFGKTFHGQSSVGDVRYDETPYGYGSDHDIFLINNIESIMYNEWPSRYYHTDMDTPDTIGYREIGLAGYASTLSLILLAKPSLLNGLQDYVKNYYGNLITWYAMESIARGLDRGFVESSISRLLGRAIRKAQTWIENRGILVYERCRTSYPIYTGRSHVPLRMIAVDKGIEFHKLIQKTKASMFLSVYLPAYLNGLYSLEDIVRLYLAEELANTRDLKKIECYGARGLGCIEKIAYTVIEWVEEKGFIKK